MVKWQSLVVMWMRMSPCAACFLSDCRQNLTSFDDNGECVKWAWWLIISPKDNQLIQQGQELVRSLYFQGMSFLPTPSLEKLGVFLRLFLYFIELKMVIHHQCECRPSCHDGCFWPAGIAAWVIDRWRVFRRSSDQWCIHASWRGEGDFVGAI